MKHFLLLTFLTTFLLTNITAQITCPTDVKGLYVNDFKLIVGNAAAENDLLTYAQDSGFNYLILYNLFYIHNNLFDITDATTSLPLSDFINKAKTLYGIHSIAGVGEKFSSFDNIHAYNLLHLGDANRLIDVYNLEFEFWNSTSTAPGGYYCTTYLTPNSLACDTANAFDFYLEELCRIDSLCDANDYISSETYIGNPTVGQCTALSGCADRILVHYYRTSDVYTSGNSIYNFKSYRLPALAAAAELSVVMPIFACTDDFMGEWLLSNSHNKPMDTWLNGLNGYNDDTGTWKSNTCVQGHVWYRYTCMNPDGILTTLLEKEVSKQFFIYPNPTNGRLVFESEKEFSQNSEISIVDQLGRQLPSNIRSRSGRKVILSVDGLSPGMYWLRIEGTTRPFVVERP